MSAYGKLWEEVSEIRQSIKREYPGVRTNRLEEAREDAAGKPEFWNGTRLHAYIVRWTDLEKKMERVE